MLALKPSLLIADEPTSALDVSVQAKVLELFKKLQAEIGFACLFITHDLAVVDMLADRIMVMHKGQIVEHGDADQIMQNPQNPYTQKLLASLPVPDPREQRKHREHFMMYGRRFQRMVPLKANWAWESPFALAFRYSRT